MQFVTIAWLRSEFCPMMRKYLEKESCSTSVIVSSGTPNWDTPLPRGDLVEDLSTFIGITQNIWQTDLVLEHWLRIVLLVLAWCYEEHYIATDVLLWIIYRRCYLIFALMIILRACTNRVQRLLSVLLWRTTQGISVRVVPFRFYFKPPRWFLVKRR